MRAAALFLALLLVLPLPVRVVEKEKELAEGLWPGFEPEKIPAAIFDGRRTYLFNHPSPPEDFRREKHYWVFPGRHPSVVANTAGKLGGVLTAFLILPPPPFSRVKIAPLTALLLHEKFHVFQARRYPHWKANEAARFTYPWRKQDVVFAALMEIEALKRALEDSRWLAVAVKMRRRRFSLLGRQHIEYERGVELVEGTAFYVQAKAEGRMPELDSWRADQVRRRLYLSGLLLCLLLDRLRPGWKAELSRPGVYLDELLRQAAPQQEAVFDPELEKRVAEEAKERIQKALRYREKLLEKFNASKCFLEVVSKKPLWPAGFDPMNLVDLEGNRILHLRWLRLEGEAGWIEIMGRPSLTWAKGPHPLFNGVLKLKVALKNLPSYNAKNEKILIKSKHINALLRGFTKLQPPCRLILSAGD